MRKLLLFVVVALSLSGMPTISTEHEFQLSPKRQYQLVRPSYAEGYDHIPANPTLHEETVTYKDEELTQKAGKLSFSKSFTILSLRVNTRQEPIFELADGTFLPANSQLIYDDQVLSQTETKASYWVKPDTVAMTSPLANQAKKADKQPKPYTPTEVTELVTTPRGDFAKTNQGWVPMSQLSPTDNRMEKVAQVLKDKYNKPNLSIYVQQLSTGLTAGVNQDKVMYTASTAKLATLYYAQLQLDKGSIRLADKLVYIPAVNDFGGHYLPAGSGDLPKKANDKSYSVEELIHLTAKKSDNVASNILSYYLTDQFDQNYYDTMDSLLGQRWGMDEKNGTAKMAGQVMAAIYQQNPTGLVLESLSATAFDNERIAKAIDVKVAHKIGDAYDFKHDVAVVYSSSPFVLSIYTDKSDYDQITAIANDVYAILKWTWRKHLKKRLAKQATLTSISGS